MIDITIVDDKKEEISNLKEFLNQYQKEKNECFDIKAFTNPNEVLNFNLNSLEIVLLDIEMPQMDGMTLANIIRKNNPDCVIIFVTNMAQFAIKGYEVEALAFLVKPLRYNSFSFKMDRAIEISKKNKKNQISIITNYEKIFLSYSDVIYIEVDQHQLIYHTFEKDYETWGSMSKTASELINNGFALVNASQLVNLRYVKKITKEFVIVHEKELYFSKSKKKTFLDALTEFTR